MVPHGSKLACPGGLVLVLTVCKQTVSGVDSNPSLGRQCVSGLPVISAYESD